MKSLALLRSSFIRLGLEPKIADLYQALQTHGPQTISELARNSGIERIQIYRLLDELKASSLVEFETRYKRSILHAAPITTLQVLIAKRDQELKELQQNYATLVSTFASRTMESKTTSVKFYEGIDGIKQMLWNETRKKGENLAFLYENMQHKTNLAFFERWVRWCNEREIRFRGIIGDHFINTQKTWYAKYSNERLTYWQARYIPESVFSIPYSLVTYDEVVLHYNWNADKMFGIEIHNPAIAQMQRQFFELVWEQAEEVDDLVGIRQHPQ